MDPTPDPTVRERELVDYQANSLQRHAIEFGEWMMRSSLLRSHALGHAALRPAHARLLVALRWEGSRTSEIAKALEVSKNAVGQLVSELEAFGYLERAPDPRDGRAKIVRYTPKGVALISDAAAIGKSLDADIAEAIGDDRLAQLRSILADLCDHFQLGPIAEDM